MKWYWALWAILITVAILGCFTALLKIGGQQAMWFVHFGVALTAVWAAAESSSRQWGFFVLLLWPIAFPCFLIRHYARRSDVDLLPTGEDSNRIKR
jgi:hypothetical protein